MSLANLDLVLAFSMENVFYLSGALFLLQDNIRDRLAAAGIAADGRDFLVCATNEMSGVQATSHVAARDGYAEFAKTPMAALAERISAEGLADARIGVEKRYLGVHYFEELVGLLPKARFSSADRVIETTRAIKTPAHIEAIETASRATERAVATGFASVHVGDSERDLALAIINGLFKEGASTIRHAVITAGDNAKHAHPSPSAAKILSAGDLIRTDVGGLFNGFGTDIARMAVVGAASPEQRKLYGALSRCVSEIGQRMRAGMTAGEVYDQVCAFYEREGIPSYRRDHVGHSLSILGGHDEPLLYGGNATRLETGMVIALEPILTDEAGRRCALENVFAVGMDSSQLLTCEKDTTEMTVVA